MYFILKITRLFDLVSKAFMPNNNKVVSNGGNRVDKIVKILFKFKNLKNIKFKILIRITIKVIREFIFLIFNVKEVFNYLQQIFIKVSIFQYFSNPKYHI